ncbi:succinyl-diaminopimelate desuccinylase [Luteococcus sp. Sow4_B9]|uniref:succinyl-diaminopimelate desuccinylase n=1 Tax=Luteococcus sp. Sow4_B9 TaxID=3438792 RepID=UPI003F95A73B
MDALDLEQPLPTLLRALVDVESVSGNEQQLADLVERALERQPHLHVTRLGNTVVARTELDRPQRVVVAGHLDTVPVAGNLPSQLRTTDGEQRIHGRGSCDMKGGVAVALQLAAELRQPRHDVTWIFYDNEEVSGPLNGLGLTADAHPELVQADFAILMEPTRALVEGGCQGTLRFWVSTRGVAAHSARGWMGHNAIHDLRHVLERIVGFEQRTIEVDGLAYREGLNAVQVSGGVAGNVIPDECRVHVNYRYAPDREVIEARAVMERLFDGFELDWVDLSPAARPGLHLPMARDFVDAVGGTPGPKYGWTDVARFSALGIPAVNFGPGDPSRAHTDDEFCPVEDLHTCAAALRRWLQPAGQPQ